MSFPFWCSRCRVDHAGECPPTEEQRLERLRRMFAEAGASGNEKWHTPIFVDEVQDLDLNTYEAAKALPVPPIITAGPAAARLPDIDQDPPSPMGAEVLKTIETYLRKKYAGLPAQAVAVAVDLHRGQDDFSNAPPAPETTAELLVRTGQGVIFDRSDAVVRYVREGDGVYRVTYRTPCGFEVFEQDEPTW